jgi:hypothetical protein
MAQPTTSIKLNGPLFDTPRQFSLGLQEAVDRGLLDIAQFEGANVVKEQLWGPPASQYDTAPRSAKHGAKTRVLRNHIGAKMTDHVAQFDAGETLAADGRNLVYASWVEGISARNQSSSFKGYGMFKNAYEHIDNNPKLYEKYIGDAIIEALE